MKIILDLLRVRDWAKNLFVFLPIIFGGELLVWPTLLMGIEVFACFCLISSSIYILNDVHDRDYDRSHPRKRNRPIAAGLVNRSVAWGCSLTLGCAGFITALFLLRTTPGAIGAMFGYAVLNLAYTYFLKDIAIIDVISIATGFVLRVVAGGYACGIWVSPWLIVMTFMLTLFIAVGKRRDDVIRNEEGSESRKSASGYSLEYIDMTMGILSACLLVAYLIYSLSPEVEARFHSGSVYLTAIFVVAGILRYMQVAIVKRSSGDPTRLFYRDPFIICCCVLWLLSFILIIYG
ncbi:MAG: UbiA prenyltransferase family protein [Muribaculaceae bacterium]|nr:UbiA prenyltransferase family protein [Muribaculaceae bacterium]